MDGSTVALVVAVLVIGILIFVAILVTGKRGHHFNIEEYQTRFLKIENTFKKDNKLSYAVTVTEADKLLDKALIEAGIMGKTMGERLKKCTGRFEDLDAVWRAHKLRNLIAHETDFEVSYIQAKNALEIYKKALKDLGAI